ncbi:MAG: hypothetical protein KJZ65_10475 [Phycisphaerales bacterium]|nr:hypothetical protein [Phycisphaerales bacterium]
MFNLTRLAGVCVIALLSLQSLAADPAQLLDHAALRRLAVGERTLLDRFPLGRGGQVALDLERFSILAPGAQVVEGTMLGDRPLPPSDLVLLKGTVVGDDADSNVFMAVGRWGVNGFISRANSLHWITTGPYAGILAPQPRVRVTDTLDLTEPMPPFCGWSPDNPELNPPRPARQPTPRPSDRTTGCESAVIAIDTDYEFTANVFGGNTVAAADYALTLLGAVSTIYERDVNVSMTVGYLRVWGTDVDPYGDEAEMGAFLNKLRSHWRNNMQGISRVVTHGLSGRGLGGGVAWVGVLCSSDYGYAVSTGIAGSFPLPPTDHHWGNWDPFVVAHELGHNFGTGHTHDSYDPVIDGCGLGDCSAAWGGTIMSYCHGCPGGMANIVLSFPPRVQEVIEATVANAGCFTFLESGFAAIDDRGETVINSPILINVLRNDIDASCGVPTLASVQSPTSAGGTAIITGAAPSQAVVYTPPPNFNGTDTFTYANHLGQIATVRVGVHVLRAPAQPVNAQPGVRVDYYQVPSIVALPDFNLLTPYLADVVPQINYPSTTTLFATSGRANLLAAVYRGYISVSFPGLYTFETESDEGSRLFVGNQLVVNNDGLHAMRSASGVVGLQPGLHEVRVEYFEANGPAGLILRHAMYPNSTSVTAAGVLFHEAGSVCVADFNRNGAVDFFDLQSFLTAFANHDLSADLMPDGVLNFYDVQLFLNAFAAGCP